jgi:hypothetical protein
MFERVSELYNGQLYWVKNLIKKGNDWHVPDVLLNKRVEELEKNKEAIQRVKDYATCGIGSVRLGGHAGMNEETRLRLPNEKRRG